MEIKKIKKLTKVNRNSTVRFKKTCLRPQRAQTGVITKPPREINETETYQIESDLIFVVQDAKPVFDISVLNHYKYVTSVEVRKDLNEKIATLLLEPYQTSSRTTCSTLANEAKLNEEWTKALISFGDEYEGFLQEFLDSKKETSLQKKMFLFKMREQTAAKRLYLLSTYPAFEMRYRMRKDEIQCTELCFNETFLRESGYTLENFTSTVLNEGLPQFFPLSSPAMMDTMQGLMENYMINESELPEQEVDLLMKTGYKKKIVLQALVLVELSETDLILSLVFFMKMKSLPYGNYQKPAFSQEFLEILKDHDKQKENLFKTYYGEKCHGLHSNTEKVCKIKEISPCRL